MAERVLSPAVCQQWLEPGHVWVVHLKSHFYLSEVVSCFTWFSPRCAWFSEVRFLLNVPCSIWRLIGKSSCLWRLSKDPAETATLKNRVVCSPRAPRTCCLCLPELGSWELGLRTVLPVYPYSRRGKWLSPDQVTVRTQEGGMNSCVERKCRQAVDGSLYVVLNVGRVR